MVKYCLMFMLSFSLFAATDVKITIDIDQAYAQQPVKGIISITHNPSAKIDIDSFQLGEKTLVVKFVKDVPFTSKRPTVLSLYNFEIPGQPAGLYSLPSLSVRVGNQTYQSSMSSYSVDAAKEKSASESAPQPSIPLSASTSKPVLRLEASVDGPISLYPGQRTKLVYHYYYTGFIELITEHLPLLDTTGLIKIGEKEFKDYSQDNVSISEISQVVEASKPGQYSFPPSLIEGYTYLQDSSGSHVRTSQKLSSEAPGISITVLPFPSKDKPSSFNGAIGTQYQFHVSLISDATISMGDTISLGIDITGPGNIKQVPAPEVCCQPGFTGIFSTNNLPPTEKVTGNTKRIIVQLRPLTPGIKEIPSVEFSYFNPSTQKYTTLQSVPIPIKINLSKTPNNSQVIDSTGTPQPAQEKKPSTYHPTPIEIKRIMPLESSDLYNKLFGTWWTLIFLPLGVALCIYQIQIRRYLLRKSGLPSIQTSDILLKEALKQKPGSSQYFKMLSDSMKMALVEHGMLSSIDTSIENIPQEGIANEVRAFLVDLDEQHFVNSDQTDYNHISTQAQSFIDQLHGYKQDGDSS